MLKYKSVEISYDKNQLSVNTDCIEHIFPFIKLKKVKYNAIKAIIGDENRKILLSLNQQIPCDVLNSAISSEKVELVLTLIDENHLKSLLKYSYAPIAIVTELIPQNHENPVETTCLLSCKTLNHDFIELFTSFAYSFPSLVISALNDCSIKICCMIFRLISNHRAQLNSAVSTEFINEYVTTNQLEKLNLFISPGLDPVICKDLYIVTAKLYFGNHLITRDVRNKRLPASELTPFQRAVLLAIGLQDKKYKDIALEYDSTEEQVSIHLKIALKHIKNYLMYCRILKSILSTRSIGI